MKVASVLLVAAAGLAALAQPGLGFAAQIDQAYRDGVAAFESGRMLEALDLLTGVATKEADFQRVQLLLGQCYLATNQLRQAKEHFERALTSDPANGHAAFLLGLTFYQSARYFEAEAALLRARRLSPGNPHPLIYRGRALLKLGRPEEALAEIEAAMAISPAEASAREALAELRLAQGELSSAEKLARELVAETPEAPAPNLLLGRILLQSHRAAEALPVLRRARTGNPNRSETLYLLSQALLRSGDTKQGRELLKRFQQLKAVEERIRVLEGEIAGNPAGLESRLELIRILLEHGFTQIAIPHMRALERLAPQDARVLALVTNPRH